MSTKTQHTPGPWHVRQKTGYPHPITISADKSCCDGPVRIAEVFHSANYTAEANAQFIAHACNSHDDLLAACQDLVAILKHHDYTHGGCSICADVRAARQAIARAEGEGA